MRGSQYASQERGIKGDFGAAKMRFDEGEERAACAHVAATRHPLHVAGIAQGHGPSCSCVLREERTSAQLN
jgi:hypothetical protein